MKPRYRIFTRKIVNGMRLPLPDIFERYIFRGFPEWFWTVIVDHKGKPTKVIFYMKIERPTEHLFDLEKRKYT